MYAFVRVYFSPRYFQSTQWPDQISRTLHKLFQFYEKRELCQDDSLEGRQHASGETHQIKPKPWYIPLFEDKEQPLHIE